MFSSEYKRLNTVTRALDIARVMGDNVPFYIDKLKTAIAKDRVAMSFISDSALEPSKLFSSTIIQVTNNNIASVASEEERMVEDDFERQRTDMFKSSGVLTYEATMALVYKLRIDGYIVNDVANIREGLEAEFISVEELHNSTDIIRISASDRIIPIIDDVIKKNEFRINERHTSRIMTVYSKSLEDTEIQEYIKIAFKRAFKLEEIYIVKSENNKEYEILSSTGVACVKYNNSITIVSIADKIDCRKMQISLRDVLDRAGIEYELQTTGELIMI